jgi:hypothetical protein
VPEDPTTPTPPNAAPPPEFIDPVTWTRQVVLVKHERPDGPHYVVLRDGFQGTGEDFSEFSLWCLATGVQTRDNTARYTGQHGVDLTVTVLDPAKPTFATGQYGHKFLYGPAAPFWRKMNGNKPFEEIQHFIRLKRTDHRGYFTVLYPHRPDEAPPAFTPWANGAGVTAVVQGERHVVVCADAPGKFAGNGITVEGQRAVVRDGNGRTVLALLQGTLLKAGGHALAADGPAAVTITRDGITGEANFSAPGTLTLSAPEAHGMKAYLLVDGQEQPLEAKAGNGSLTLTLPAGRCAFVMR